MKRFLVTVFVGLVLAVGSVSISNAAPRNEDNRLIAQMTIYKHVQAMKWQRGSVVGTVTIKINTKTGDTFYNDRKLHVQDNPHYVSWDDSCTDPRSKYQCVSYVHTNSERFELYFNY